MEGPSAPPPAYQLAPEIPSEIFQPLVSIAQRGYDANDIKNWYQIIQRHLRRMGMENAEAAYTLVTPVSDKKVPFSSDADSSSVHQTVEPGDSSASGEDHVSPKTRPGDTVWSWSRSPSFEPSYEPSLQGDNDISVNRIPQQVYSPPNEQMQGMQIHLSPSTAPAPQPIYQTSPNQPQPQSVLVMPPNPMLPRASTFPQPHPNNISTTAHDPSVAAFAEHGRGMDPWFSSSPENYSAQPGHMPQPQYGHPWAHSASIPMAAQPPGPYQVAMSNTAMPVLVPFHPPPQPLPMQPLPMQPLPMQPHPQQMYEEPDFVNPFSSGGLSQLATEVLTSPYFPTIDIIPSRKRRKMLQKGVKRVSNVIQSNRQASI